MKKLGAIPTPFATYVNYHGGNLLKWYGPRRLERMFAHRTFLDWGIPVASASDYPCGPFEPLLAFQSCTTREGWDGTPLGLNQRISPYEALALYTTGAAYATGENQVKGRLAPSFLADFVVLGDDPLTADPRNLSTISVLETYVGGRQVWRHGN
jgi:predicted amidohydrolase YtcJ